MRSELEIHDIEVEFSNTQQGVLFTRPPLLLLSLLLLLKVLDFYQASFSREQNLL